MATISDVAKLSGTSVSTVSRVINDMPHVSEKKRTAIEAAMKKLGYVPQPAARQLRGSKSNTVAVTVPRIVNPFFSYLVDGIERRLDEAGYRTLIVQTFSRSEEEIAVLNMLKSQQIDGVILCSIESDWSQISEYLQYGQIVLVNEYLPDTGVPVIRADQYQAFYDATNFLFDQGYRRIAYATGRRSVTMAARGENFDADRFDGFQDALSTHEIAFNWDWLFTRAHTEEDGRRICEELLDLSQRPDAIIAGSDEVAMGIIQAADEHNVAIPTQLAVLGVDDQPLPAHLKTPLTTLRQPTTELSHAAAQAMIDSIAGKSQIQTPLLQLKVIKRASA